MKSLVLGAKGLVGSHIFRELIHRGENAVAEERREFDLSGERLPQWDDILGYYSPDIVYLCSANAHVNDCETNPFSWITNVSNTINFIHLANEQGIRVVFFSSSYVFDGRGAWAYRPHDHRNPLNVYGKQKVAVENYILGRKDIQNTIIRTVGVFGGKDNKKKNFLCQVLSQQKLHWDNVHFFNPISATRLARETLDNTLNSIPEDTIIHLAGNTNATKERMSFDILERAVELGYISQYGSMPDGNDVVKRPVNGSLLPKTFIGSEVYLDDLEEEIKNFYE